MRNILFLFIIVSNSIAAQNMCTYSSNTSSNANGLKIKLSIPCDWEESLNDEVIGVLKFTYKGDGLLATASLGAVELGNQMTESDAKKIISLEGIKNLTKARGKYISSQLFTLNDVKCGEIIKSTTMNVENSIFYFYNITNIFIYQKRIVSIEYTIGARNETFIEVYPKYLNLFRDLIKKTLFQ